LCNDLSTPQDLDPLGEYAPPLLGGDWCVDASLVELVVVGHIDVPGACPEVSYLAVPGFESRCQAVDVVSGFSDLLGGNVGPSFDGGGEAEGHGAGDFAEFLLTEADERLSQAGGERGVAFIWWVDSDTERWWGDFLD